MTTTTKKPAKRMDRRTSERMGKLAGKVLKAGGVCTPYEARRLAGCVLSQIEPPQK